MLQLVLGSLALAGIARFALLRSLTTPTPAAQAPAAQATAATLYQRLGGYDFLARFVDTAFPRVAGDPQLSRMFRGHSLDSQLRQRQLIVDIFCQVTGGPCFYLGRAMKPVHTGLGITGADWTTFITIIAATLDEFDLPAAAKQAFLALIEQRFRPDVVEQP